LILSTYYVIIQLKDKEKDMAHTYGTSSMEKVTFNIPAELKEQVIALKER